MQQGYCASSMSTAIKRYQIGQYRDEQQSVLLKATYRGRTRHSRRLSAARTFVGEHALKNDLHRLRN